MRDGSSFDRLRILLISRCPPYPLHLGDRLIVYHLARELSARGHIIDLLAFDDGVAPDEPDAYQRFFRKVTLLPDPERGMVDYLRRLAVPSTRFPREAAGSWSPKMWRAIREHLVSDQYDLAHLFGGIQVYEYANALESLKSIITPYESYSLYLQRQIDSGGGFGTRLRAWAAGRYETWMFVPYRRIIVLTDADREEFHFLNPYLNVEVIPNGVDLAYFTPQGGEQRQPHTLLFTGNFAYQPNLDAAFYLIEQILPRVQDRLPDARLWLVGANPPPELSELADADDLIVTGQVVDMRPYLAKAAVFACPLRFGAGIKNKVLEALAMGCPVVGSPVSFDGIGISDGVSAVVAPDDADDFASAVIRALDDANLLTRLSLNGRKLIEGKYNWASVAERYEALYRDLTD